MLRATAILRRAAVTPDRVADVITLDHGDRHRRRIALTAAGGLAFLLDLERATVVADGDAAVLEDGRLVLVRAAPERLAEVRAASSLRLLRLAWHIGNRHVPCEITADALYILNDHVLVAMVRGLGAETREVLRPFQPERGAYHDGDGHHDHGHAPGRDRVPGHGH